MSSILVDATGSISRSSTVAEQPAVGLVCDFVEEGWPSMAYYADTLFDELKRTGVAVTKIQPRMPQPAVRLEDWIGSRRVHNIHRLIGRYWSYPRKLKAEQQSFDLFHIVDHSYSHLAYVLPPGRVVITCHDIDTFRSVLQPEVERRPAWFRMIAGRIREGFQTAARVVCDSKATESEVLSYGLCTPERTVVVLPGVHTSCSPEPDLVADAQAERLLDSGQRGVELLLHVGSTIPRKRIDVLLSVFSEIQKVRPQTRLVRVGGPFEAEQERLARSLGILDKIIVLPFLERQVLAAVYRKAALVLLPSESEGFGLPLLEAAACGAPVVASDIQVLREIGGPAAVYCPVGEIGHWARTVMELLHEKIEATDSWNLRRTTALHHAARFRWSETARQISVVYSDLWQLTRQGKVSSGN